MSKIHPIISPPPTLSFIFSFWFNCSSWFKFTLRLKPSHVRLVVSLSSLQTLGTLIKVNVGWHYATLSAKHGLATLQPTIKAIKATTSGNYPLRSLHHSSKVYYYQKLILGVCASIPYKERHVIWKINWNINFIGRFSHSPPAPTHIHSNSPSMGVPWTPLNFLIIMVPTIQFN